MNKIISFRTAVKYLSKTLSLVSILCFGSAVSAAQSTVQNFPTPVTSNQISGSIRARDVGDARLTTYFYTFNGTQGDVFINVVTNNFNGDIDVFNAENLNPLTKIVVFADNPNNETGRVVYLRKPEKLILRIQGRTPNDEPATYTIKFAGSFQPVLNVAETEPPKAPEVTSESRSDIIVNSVGTIIAVKPKPTPTPAETDAKIEEEQKAETESKEIKETAAEEKKSEEAQTAEKSETEPEKKVEVVVTDALPQAENAEKVEKTEKTEKAEAKPAPPARRTRTGRRAANTRAKPEPKPAAPNPLENVRLIILFKDGSTIERPMSEVSRVNVDNKGVLTIVSKDGTIGRYSILDVAKMTIE
jgi:hypothetical protein